MIDEPQAPGGQERPSETSDWSTVPPSSYRPPDPPAAPPPAQSLEPLPPPQGGGGYGQVYGTGAAGEPAGTSASGPGGGYTPPPGPPPGYPVGGPGPQYPPGAPPPGVGQGLSSNAAAAISYLTFIPAVIFLAVAPYNRDRFVRFHAWQSIALWIVAIAISIVFTFLSYAGFHLLWWTLHSLIDLVLFVFWLIAVIKASQGQWYKIPIVGDLAQNFAGAQ